jgi:hypothetical protein
MEQTHPRFGWGWPTRSSGFLAYPFSLSPLQITIDVTMPQTKRVLSVMRACRRSAPVGVLSMMDKIR